MLSFYAVPHTVVSSEVGTRGLLVSLLFLHPNTHDPHTQAHRASSPGATSLDPQTQTSRLPRSFWDSPIPTHPPPHSATSTSLSSSPGDPGLGYGPSPPSGCDVLRGLRGRLLSCVNK